MDDITQNKSRKLVTPGGAFSDGTSQHNSNHLLFLFIASTVFILVVIGTIFVYQKRSGELASTSTKLYHVGILSALEYFYPAVEGFKKKMTELGYVEGKNIVYDVQKGSSPIGNYQIIKKFVAQKVNLILVFPTEASLEAKAGTKGTTIPIISIASYLEGNGLIDSISHPGGTITGVRFPVTETAAKSLEILHQIAPTVKRVWIPYLRNYPTAAPSLAALMPVAQSFDIRITSTSFATPSEMATYFASKKKNDVGMDAILLVPEPIAIVPGFVDEIVAFARVHKLPIGGARVRNSDDGSLFSLAPNNLEFGRMAAPLADKILRGISAGSLPIGTPENELEINYRAIIKLGLTVDEGLLSRAVKIIR